MTSLISQKQLLKHSSPISDWVILYSVFLTKSFYTETPLLSVHDHIARSLLHAVSHLRTNGLLHVYGVFACIDHSILPHHLSSWVGAGRTVSVLDWIISLWKPTCSVCAGLKLDEPFVGQLLSHVLHISVNCHIYADHTCLLTLKAVRLWTQFVLNTLVSF